MPAPFESVELGTPEADWRGGLKHKRPRKHFSLLFFSFTFCALEKKNYKYISMVIFSAYDLTRIAKPNRVCVCDSRDKKETHTVADQSGYRIAHRKYHNIRLNAHVGTSSVTNCVFSQSRVIVCDSRLVMYGLQGPLTYKIE